MREVLIRNSSRPQARPLRAGYCNSFFCRLRGLMFRRDLPENWGLLLVQARDNRLDASIHMFFMWMDLAVIWINAAGEVVDVRLAKRWAPGYLPAQPARYVLETSVDNLEMFRPGERVEFLDA